MEYQMHYFDDEEAEDKGEISKTISKTTINGEDNFSNESLHYETTRIDGMVRISLSPLTQRILDCEIGENVTTEYPWIFIRKEIIEDNLDLHPESSDFLPIQNEINNYPGKNILIGYAPTSTSDRQFYICLTEESRDQVMKEIDQLRSDQENRVKNAVFKSIGDWHDLGSGLEVEEFTVKNNRPLIETQVTVNGHFFERPIDLINRNAEEQRDGYVEIVTTRQTFNNVTRRLVSRGDQTNPTIRDNKAQTTTSIPINSWFQYSYDWEPINTTAYNEEEDKAVEKFLQSHTDDICEKVLMNATWDLHANEYENLVKHPKDMQTPALIAYTEYQTFHDAKLTKERVINDLCWHPLWTGIAVAAYTQHSKSEDLIRPSLQEEIQSACQGDNHVLVWSFSDCLAPKLILECPREVTAVSMKPLDGNIVIGGCYNGQIAVWSINGLIEKTETIAVSSAAQVKYKITMKSLMSWMKETTGSLMIRPTAMSSLQNSQKGPITQIVWLPSHSRISENGRIVELDAGVDVEELGWQFVTSSEDGTVAFWDLRIKEELEIDKAMNKKKKKKKNIVRKPEVLERLISPLKVLDGLFSPAYMLTVKHPEEERRVVITTMSFHVTKLEKVQVEPYPDEKDGISTRKYYRPVVEKPNHETPRMILVGTLEGDIGRIAWEGFEFATGLTMNSEAARWIWRNTAVHDGPITHLVRSKYLDDVILTVGGKAFAVWREDFDEPVFMKRSTVRYTACSWGTLRPTVIILARGDGTVEIWDLIVKSHEACFTQSLSGRIITGIYTHELHLNPQCVAFCDFNGAMRIFVAPADLLVFEESDIHWMRMFVDREVGRIIQFKRWEKSWGERNVKSTEQHGQEKEKEMEQNPLDGAEKTGAEMTELVEKIGLKPAQTRKPGAFLEKARAQWKAMELRRMQQIILEEKGMRAEDLEKRRAPLLKLRREAQAKKERIQKTMSQQDKIFEETLAFLIPEQVPKIKAKHKYNEEPEKDEKKLEMKALIQHIRKDVTSPILNREIIREFDRVSMETLAAMKRFRLRDSFDWRKMITEGEMRRHSIDIELKKMTKKRKKADKTDILH